jgi:hypothetical protein
MTREGVPAGRLVRDRSGGRARALAYATTERREFDAAVQSAATSDASPRPDRGRRDRTPPAQFHRALSGLLRPPDLGPRGTATTRPS